MLQEHDNQFEDIDFDTPRRHSLQLNDNEYGRLVDNQTDDEEYDEQALSTLKAIARARRSHANELEQRNEMLQYIASKERLVEDLREQLRAHEMELWLLKENWTHIVTQSSSSPSPSPYIHKNNEESDKIRHFSQKIANHEKNVAPENIPRTAYDGLISVYQNLRDTLENVAPAERY
ncbi:hypothetical protein BC943DRAFT_322905 [Umbelopsis sp. AD052]|nr:hypothetical protein BC943DRAFT_322905 [Umbelopsis sp. AD052]